MTANVSTDGKTEADLEARANSALLNAMPWLDVAGIRHQLTFSFRLGHRSVKIDGTKSSKRQGRVDILIESGGKRLAILELKRPDKPLTKEDLEQGLSYARILHPRPPLVIVSNGVATRTYATHTGELLKDGVSSEQDFADLVAAAMQVAESDLRDAITTLMGPRSEVWMAAVRAATEQTVDELTGDWTDRQPVFTTDFHFRRKALLAVLEALRGSRRVIAIEGAPLAGKSHVLREIAEDAMEADDMAVLLVEASGTAASGIAEEVARLLGAAVGWRIGAEEARHWMENLGASSGPLLVVAVDGLGLDHDAIRRELEALTAKSIGSRLKFVVEADTSVVDRLWLGETRRKETVFARRGIRIPVKSLDDEEFKDALQALDRVGATFMEGADKADEYRQPWLLRSMAASVAGTPQVRQELVAVLPPLLSVDLFKFVRKRFIQNDITEHTATFARAVLDDYARSDRSVEVRLRAMHTFMVRKQTMREHAEPVDLGVMEKSGLVGSVLDRSNRAILTARIPELVASELARQIGAELNERMGNDKEDIEAANWLVTTTSRLPLGDVIGAQALVDLLELRLGVSVTFLNRLLQRGPSVRPFKPGTRAAVWMPSIGQLELSARADGVTVIKKPEWIKGIEMPADEGGQVYAELDAWLILSHLASMPIGVIEPDDGRLVGRVDPDILALIGTSPIPLRRVSEDPERASLHTHNLPDGSSMVCQQDGIIEPVTFSMLQFLGRERENADGWLDEACDRGSAAMLNRLSQALSRLSSMNPAHETAKWARERNERQVGPALQRALASACAVAAE